MPDREPLTAAELADMYHREPTEVVKALLWEIHRLRALIRRANQIMEMSKAGPVGPPETLWEAFGIALAKEPVLTDPRTERQTRMIDESLQRLKEGKK